MPTSSDYDSQSDSGKDDHKDEESKLVIEEVLKKEEPENANETKSQGKADNKEDKKLDDKKNKIRNSSDSNSSHNSEKEEKIDTKNGNKKSKSSVKSGGKDRENKGSGKRLIESKKKRYSSTGNNQDKSSHGSDNQKSNGDGKHVSQSDNDKINATWDSKGKYKDEGDDKGKDMRGGKNDRKSHSDSEGKGRENNKHNPKRQMSADENNLQNDTEYQMNINSDRSSSKSRNDDNKKGKTGKGKDIYRDNKLSNKNKKRNRSNDSDSDKKSGLSNSDDSIEDSKTRGKSDRNKIPKNKKKRRDYNYNSPDEEVSTKSKKRECVFAPRDKTGVSYIDKELMIKYIQYSFPGIQNIEQSLKIVPKSEYKYFCKKNNIRNDACKCTSKRKCDLHHYANKKLKDEYDNCDTENCTVVIMDTNKIDCKKMRKIVENAVFREDTDHLEEITEQFIEFLKENVDVKYNNESKKLKSIPCILTLVTTTIQIKFIYDRNYHQIPEFLKNAIRAKYEDYRVYEIAHVYYLNFSNNNMLKNFFQIKEDAKVLESLKPIFNLIVFEAKNEKCIAGTMKKYLKAEFEVKTKKDLENLILVQIKIIEDCSVKYDEMVEQVFIRNAKFPHPIYKCSNKAFTVSFKLASKSIFLTTLDQTQKENVESVKQEMITKFKEIFSDACTLNASYMFPLQNLKEYKTEIWKINGRSMSDITDAIDHICASEITTVYTEELKTDCDFSCIQLNEKDTPKFMRKQYVLINYSFYFTSADNKSNFKKELMSEDLKVDNANKFSINECIIIDKNIKYSKYINEKKQFGIFCEFLKERSKF